MKTLIHYDVNNTRKTLLTIPPHKEKVLLIVQNSGYLNVIEAEIGTIQHSIIKAISGLQLNKLPNSLSNTDCILPILNSRISEVHTCVILD